MRDVIAMGEQRYQVANDRVAGDEQRVDRLLDAVELRGSLAASVPACNVSVSVTSVTMLSPLDLPQQTAPQLIADLQHRILPQLQAHLATTVSIAHIADIDTSLISILFSPILITACE